MQCEEEEEEEDETAGQIAYREQEGAQDALWGLCTETGRRQCVLWPYGLALQGQIISAATLGKFVRFSSFQ